MRKGDGMRRTGVRATPSPGEAQLLKRTSRPAAA